jgi:hypothetical protein
MRKMLLLFHVVFVLIASMPLLMGGGFLYAAEYWLWADTTTKTMPDGRVITLWGFGLDKDNNFATGGPGTADGYDITVPGPAIRVGHGDATLTIHLKNRLPEPVSLDIIGQALAVNNGPVWTNFPEDTATWTGSRPQGQYYYTARVRSFAHEAQPFAGEATYVWGTMASPFKPGSYVLQSGTNPAKQVQMGLYLPVVKDAGANLAYPVNPNVPGDSGVTYERELIVVFSEIDPDIHAAVAAGTYGTAPNATIKSSVYRTARYSMINGMVWPEAGLDPINMAVQLYKNEKLLVRFFNPGLETHVPTISDMNLTLWARGGNRFTYPRTQYGFELSPGDTIDATLASSESVRLPAYDARLDMTNAGATYAGGMLSFLYVGAMIPGEIERYYQSVLARSAEPGGADFWQAEMWKSSAICIDPKEGYIGLGITFFNSQEYLGKGTPDDQYIIDLYETFFNRTPSQGEIDYWVGMLTVGLTRNSILLYFVYSDEFRLYMDSNLGPVSTRAECNLVNDFYRGLLARYPDESGFRYWRSRMRAAQCAGADEVRAVSREVAQLFVSSPEYGARNRTNTLFVEDMYNAIMRRSPDPGGFAFWINLLDLGVLTRPQVLNYFVDSQEFQLRVQEVINAGCMP